MKTGPNRTDPRRPCHHAYAHVIDTRPRPIIRCFIPPQCYAFQNQERKQSGSNTTQRHMKGKKKLREMKEFKGKGICRL